MKQPLQATKISAVLSGVAVSVGMPSIENLSQFLELGPSTQNLVFMFGLVIFFFGPVLMFVVGTAHLSIKSREMIKSVYWASLRQVALRSVFWLVGCGLGSAVLSALHGVLW